MAAGPQRAKQILKKTLRPLFKKSLNGLAIFNYPKRHYGAAQKIPESLGGIQTIYPDIKFPIV
jgi:hypothetical protein